MYEVVPVTAEVTLPLRQRVLRPHQRPDEVGFDGDADPRSGHFAAVEGDAVLGVVSVVPEAPPWAPAARGWRLRGMATVPARRREGIGRALASAVVAHVAARDDGILWCNARLAAVAFYRAVGFEARGRPWDEPQIGPHVAMVWTP